MSWSITNLATKYSSSNISIEMFSVLSGVTI
jgi:hypothetical protein